MCTGQAAASARGMSAARSAGLDTAARCMTYAG
jgi:hypothetical protein